MDHNGDPEPGSARYQSNGHHMSNGNGHGPGSSSQARRRYRFEPDSSSSSPGVSPTIPNGPATKSNGVHHERGPPSHQPDTNGIEEKDNHNAFASPPASRPASIHTETASLAGMGVVDQPPQRYFHSRRVKAGDVEKPWTKNVDPKEKWVTILPLLGIALGLAISGLLIWDGIRSVVKHQYCLVYEDDFSSGVLNEKVWEREVQLGGFGYVSPPSSISW